MQLPFWKNALAGERNIEADTDVLILAKETFLEVKNMGKTDNTVKRTYKLIALDMDGTLLKSDKSIHADTARDIMQASKKGIYVVYCSGRAVPEILPYVSSLPTMRYAVCSYDV